MRTSMFFGIMLLLSTSTVMAKEQSNSLTADIAQKVALRAIDYGKKHGWKLSVAIVNSEGNLIFFKRSDGAYLGSIESSIAKAKSANAFQRSTKAFAEGVKAGNLGLLSVNGVVANEGGIPILSGETPIGAIGISGAKAIEDEEAAIAAMSVVNEK